MDGQSTPDALPSPSVGRKRKREPCAHDGLTKSARLYFDQLPDEAVENVVRFVSQRPHLGLWAHYVAADHLESLLGTAGPLREAARRLFRAWHLEISPQRVGAARAALPSAAVAEGRDVRRGGLLPEDEFLTLYGAMSASASRELRKWRGALASVYVGWFSLTGRTAEGVAEHCAGLRHLAVSTKVKRQCWALTVAVEACGRSLEALELAGLELHGPQVRAIADHCPALRRLSLRCEAVTAPLSPVWRALADPLQDVELGLPFGCPKQSGVRRKRSLDVLALSDLRWQCRGVSHLSFSGFKARAGKEAIVSACLSYGVGLRGLQLNSSWLSDKALRDIGTSCPNVRIGISP